MLLQRCREKFPHTCGLDEKKFEKILQSIDTANHGLQDILVHGRKLKRQNAHDDSHHFADSIPDDPNLREFLRNYVNPHEQSEEDMVKFKASVRDKILQSSLYRARCSAAAGASTLHDFSFLRLLGEGAFGRVYLAQQVRTKAVFAIKMVDKEEIIRGNHLDMVMTERRVLEYGRRSNFVVRLHSSFQSLDKLFFVMEYLPGGDLLFHVLRLQRFSSDQTRFYAAEIFLAVNYLHRKCPMLVLRAFSIKLCS